VGLYPHMDYKCIRPLGWPAELKKLALMVSARPKILQIRRVANMVSAWPKILQIRRVTNMVSLLRHIWLRCFQSHHRAGKKAIEREQLEPSFNHSVTELVKKKAWEENPILCQIMMEKLQSCTQWRKDFSWSPHLEQVAALIMFLWLNKAKVRATLWQARQIKNLIFSGTLILQIQFQEIPIWLSAS